MRGSRMALPNRIVRMLSASPAILAPKGSANSSSRSRRVGTTGRFTSFPSSNAAFENAIRRPLRPKASVFLTRLPAREKKASFSAVDHPKLDGTRISAGISYKKLHLLEKRQTYLTEIRKKEALPPLPERRGLRA